MIRDGDVDADQAEEIAQTIVTKLDEIERLINAAEVVYKRQRRDNA